MRHAETSEVKTQPEAADVSPTQESRGDEELQEEEEDYRDDKADGPSGAHLHQWQPRFQGL